MNKAQAIKDAQEEIEEEYNYKFRQETKRLVCEINNISAELQRLKKELANKEYLPPAVFPTE